MNQVVVTGISIQSCLGNTHNTWENILQKKSGITIAQPFEHLPPLSLGLITKNKPQITSHLTKELIIDLWSDSSIDTANDDIGVVIGSSRGCQSQWEQFLAIGDAITKELEFTLPWLETLPFEPAKIVAHFVNCRGAVMSPANACATGLVSVIQGYELIKRSLCSQVVVGAVETPVTPLTIVGFKNMKALAQNRCDPFGDDRDGLVLGEGGAMLLLETKESALARGAKIYGEITGWGLNCDANRMTAPSSTGETSIKAIKNALAMGDIAPEKIDFIHAHGTGTTLNDRLEAKIINQLFPHSPWVASTKAYTGHTLGASGAIAIALNFLALDQQKLFPHLNYSENKLNVNLSPDDRDYPLRNMLCFSFGFGGQNAVVAIKS